MAASKLSDLTTEQIQAIGRKWLRGVPKADIIKKYNITEGLLVECLRFNNINPENPRVYVTPEDKGEPQTELKPVKGESTKDVKGSVEIVDPKTAGEKTAESKPLGSGVVPPAAKAETKPIDAAHAGHK